MPVSGQTQPAGSGAGELEIVAFWKAAGPERWFAKDAAFDAALRRRFEPAHLVAAAGGLAVSAESPDAAMALVLLLDQVPRNIYRGTAHAYATDPLARDVANRALALRIDMLSEPRLRVFFYIPFQHSEDRRDQARSLRLFAAYHREYPEDSWLRYARHHARLIQRFGRFPHRNRMLGRVTTQDEQDYLDNDGFTG
jgi:uncharacterized protein (DUF924 family)